MMAYPSFSVSLENGGKSDGISIVFRFFFENGVVE